MRAAFRCFCALSCWQDSWGQPFTRKGRHPIRRACANTIRSIQQNAAMWKQWRAIPVNISTRTTVMRISWFVVMRKRTWNRHQTVIPPMNIRRNAMNWTVPMSAESMMRTADTKRL